MPALIRIVRTLPLAGLCVLLLAPRAEAEHRRIFADFDADGHRDHVTVDAHEPWIVRDRLSATRSTHVIRTAQPWPGHVAAVDSNGDCRPELIVSNRSRGLQVWTKAPGGFVVHPIVPVHPPVTSVARRGTA